MIHGRMPFSGPKDSKLPANVKKLPIGKRRRWVSIWNSVFRNCRSPSRGGGAGSTSSCETMAFRIANGTVKELVMNEMIVVLQKMKEACAEGEEEKAKILDAVIADLGREKPDGEGEKDLHGHDEPSEVMVTSRPFGGSTSFSDYDEYESAIDTELHVKELGSIFRMIVDNIFADEEMSLPQKANAVVSAATELSTRVKEPPTGGRTFLEKVKDAFKGAFNTRTGVGSHSPARIEAGSWDGAASRNELRRWASSDGSGDADKINWAQYRRGFAAFDAPGNKLGDFWGPHHRIRDGSLMTQRSGVIAAFGAARGARAGVGRSDALPHLNAHRRQFGIGQAEMETLLGVSFKELGLPDDLSLGSFTSFKDAEGRWRWMMINTNKYEDREGEIFSEKSHKEYIYFVERTGQWPELWLWHTPGTRVGQADLVDYVDGFVVHSGTYDDGLEDVAERLAKMQDKLGVSHGYEYLIGDEEDKVYDHYRSFELTLCPIERAANIWGTEFETFTKEVNMGFSPEKRKFFVDALGEERVTTLEEKLPALAKGLEEDGVSFKELVNELMPEGGEEEAGKTEAERKADEEESSEKPATPSVEDRIGAVEGQVTQIGTTLQELVDSQKTLAEGIGEQIRTGLDEALTGRKPAPGNGSKRPSEAEKTEITEEQAEEAGAKEVTVEEAGAAKAASPYVADFLGQGQGAPQG